jgi:pyruvate-formate lyase-activating enzyme
VASGSRRRAAAGTRTRHAARARTSGVVAGDPITVARGGWKVRLEELLAYRPIPAAGLFLSLTRRCPLTCAHCSTNSLLASEEHDEAIFRRLVSTFTPSDRPDVVWLTGGEALLRPALVEELAELCRAVGSRVALITGMYYARGRGIPRALRSALRSVDHVAVSQDVYHEVQVPRERVFAVVETLLDDGLDVSFQIVGRGPGDPYLAEITSEIRARFDDRVPAIVAPLGPVGRGADLAEAARRRPAAPPSPEPMPCTMAAWPVVAYDGTVVACCNQAVVDGPAPAHLRLGHALEDDWATIRARCLQQPLLQGLRVFGPQALAARAGRACGGYCETCLSLSPAEEQALVADVPAERLRALDDSIAVLQRRQGAVAFARRFGVPGYESLLAIDRPREAACVD